MNKSTPSKQVPTHIELHYAPSANPPAGRNWFQACFAAQVCVFGVGLSGMPWSKVSGWEIDFGGS